MRNQSVKSANLGHQAQVENNENSKGADKGRKKQKRTMNKPMQSFDEPRPGRSGTNEWSNATYNILSGCPHGCLYCYAKGIAKRFGRINGEWTDSVRNNNFESLGEGFGYHGVVMFPSTHDITPEIKDQAVLTILNLIEQGNKVLVVTKPHLEVIKAMCHELNHLKDSIRFRFTLGSLSKKVCKTWEPNAPSPAERLKAIKWAHGKGFDTSISIEPMLDSVEATVKLVDAVSRYVNAIWIGKMNRVPTAVDSTARALIKAQQIKPEIVCLDALLKNNAKVLWKDSILDLGIAQRTNKARPIRRAPARSVRSR
jgi:DNA repair photolyase